MTIFPHIKELVVELDSIFSGKDLPINYYKKIVESKNLTPAHQAKIVESWTSFCKVNTDNIKNKDYKNMKKIVFETSVSTDSKTDSKSTTHPPESKIFIDFVEIFTRASKIDYDEGTTEIVVTIWNHLVAICALSNPTKDSASMLKEVTDNEKKIEQSYIASMLSGKAIPGIGSTGSNKIDPKDTSLLLNEYKNATSKEDIMVKNMLQEIEKVGPDQNPMMALLNSGIWNMDTDDMDAEQMLLKLAQVAKALKNKS